MRRSVSWDDCVCRRTCSRAVLHERPRASDIVVEIASARATAMPWSGGADVRGRHAGGAPLLPVTARTRVRRRGVRVSVPIQTSVGTVRVVSKVTAAGESLEDTVSSAERPRRPNLLAKLCVRVAGRRPRTAAAGGRSSVPAHRARARRVGDRRRARSAIRAPARPQRPAAGDSVAVTERETDGRKVIAADLNLAPLSFGDCVIELTAGGDRDGREAWHFKVFSNDANGRRSRGVDVAMARPGP